MNECSHACKRPIWHASEPLNGHSTASTREAPETIHICHRLLADFKEIQGLYDTAERFIKEVELCRESVPFPAINQLRYAGHHLLKGLAADDQQRLATELNDVRDHCHRAMYEAADAGLIYLFRLLAKTQAEFSDISIASVVPEYPAILLTAKRTKQLLFQGRLKRNSPNEQVEQYMVKFRELRDGMEKLESSRPELLRAKADRKKRDLRFALQGLFWACMVILGILGVVLSL